MKAFYVDMYETTPCIIKFYNGRRETFTIIKFQPNGEIVERECRIENLFLSKEWGVSNVFFSKS